MIDVVLIVEKHKQALCVGSKAWTWTPRALSSMVARRWQYQPREQLTTT